MVERGLSAHNKLFCEGNMGKLVFIKRTDQRPEERLRLKELGVSQNKTQGTRLLSSLLTAAHGGNEAESRETAFLSTYNQVPPGSDWMVLLWKGIRTD